MKTLDTYPHDEQKEMLGMWCELVEPDENEPSLVILTGISVTNAAGNSITAGTFDPAQGSAAGFQPRSLIPRFDIPRAWYPSGAPPVIPPHIYDPEEAQEYRELYDNAAPPAQWIIRDADWNNDVISESIGVFPAYDEIQRWFDGNCDGEPLTIREARRIGMAWLSAAAWAEAQQRKREEQRNV